jgi:hypothetical protein
LFSRAPIGPVARVRLRCFFAHLRYLRRVKAPSVKSVPLRRNESPQRSSNRRSGFGGFVIRNANWTPPIVPRAGKRAKPPVSQSTPGWRSTGAPEPPHSALE